MKVEWKAKMDGYRARVLGRPIPRYSVLKDVLVEKESAFRSTGRGGKGGRSRQHKSRGPCSPNLLLTRTGFSVLVGDSHP